MNKTFILYLFISLAAISMVSCQDDPVYDDVTYDNSPKYSDETEAMATSLREKISKEIQTLPNHEWAGEYYHGDGLGVNARLFWHRSPAFCLNGEVVSGCTTVITELFRMSMTKLAFHLHLPMRGKGFKESLRSLFQFHGGQGNILFHQMTLWDSVTQLTQAQSQGTTCTVFTF